MLRSLGDPPWTYEPEESSVSLRIKRKRRRRKREKYFPNSKNEWGNISSSRGTQANQTGGKYVKENAGYFYGVRRRTGRIFCGQKEP